MTRDTVKGVAVILAWISFLLFALMGWLRTQVPWDPDLYNLLYGNSRPQKGEATGAFLFVFPTFFALCSLTFVLSIRKEIGRQDEWRAVKMLLPTAGFAFFFIGTIVRFRAVAAYYEVLG